MTTLTSLVVTVLAVVVVAVPAVAQPPVGALAIDERRGDQYGWAVDFETAAAAQGMALQECGSGCSVVLTFGRCAAYAADQDADSTAVGLGRIVRLGDRCPAGGVGGMPFPRQRYGVHRPGVGLQRSGGRRGAESEPGHAASAPVGPAVGRLRPRRARTVCSVRGRGGRFGDWQSSRGTRSTGYLDGPQVEALRGRGARTVSGVGRRRGAGCRRGGSRVLAVGPEQHEPGGLRGVSGPVPERGVQ